MKLYAPNDADDQDYAAAIKVGAKAGPDEELARWTLLLNIFFRIVALLWMIEGLEQWRRILVPASGSFLDLSEATAAAVIFFAVLDLVAAVGLWLVAPWGGVVWLLTLMAQFYVAAIKPAFFPGGPTVKLLDGLLLALYLFLSWRVTRADGDSGGAIGGLDRFVAWAQHMVKRQTRKR
jgi:hypothetical protein